jgi:hypothetical protein
LTSSARYGAWGACVALAGLPVVVATARGGEALGFGLLGWALMIVSGIGGGAWLVARHGRPGQAFIVALGASMGARLLLSAAGGAWAVSRGRDALWAYIVGLGAGYVPLQVFETAWFLRAPTVRR